MFIGCLSCVCLTYNYWLEWPIDICQNDHFLLVILTKKGSGEKVLKSRKGARPNSARLVFDICVTLMSGTINQYKINRLYCLLRICIKTSIFFCVLQYLKAEHVLERNTPAHNTSVVQNTPSEIGNTQSVSELQHAKCATL